MNKSILISIILSAVFYSCSKDDDDDSERGNWVERSVFDGIPRSSAVGFVVNNKGYMGTGYDGDDYLSDFWEYNIEGNYWVQKADFPGEARSSASGFAINNKGYLGLGYDGDTELDNFWEYNADTNAWEEKAPFAGGIRRAAVGFGANNLGYIGTGYDGENDRKDFWKYDPIEDEWTEILGFGGNKRRDATAFVLNDKVYFGTGVTNGSYQTDFWVFDPTSETWTRKKDLDDDDDYSIVRSNAVSFSIDGLGYIATGYNYSSLSTVWEYNPSNDEWEELADFEGTIRQDAVCFNDGNRAFVLLGRTGSLYMDDNYELFPQQESDDED